jgi:hypothetical protein
MSASGFAINFYSSSFRLIQNPLRKAFYHLSTFLCISTIPLYIGNNIRMLQSDMGNIATTDIGKAFAEANNYFNFFGGEIKMVGETSCNITT